MSTIYKLQSNINTYPKMLASLLSTNCRQMYTSTLHTLQCKVLSLYPLILNKNLHVNVSVREDPSNHIERTPATIALATQQNNIWLITTVKSCKIDRKGISHFNCWGCQFSGYIVGITSSVSLRHESSSTMKLTYHVPSMSKITTVSKIVWFIHTTKNMKKLQFSLCPNATNFN